MHGMPFSDMGWGEHMWGVGFGWMWLVMALFWGGLIALVVWLLLRDGAGRRPRTGGRAREILAERYARGEIDSEEYEERLTSLR